MRYYLLSLSLLPCLSCIASYDNQHSNEYVEDVDGQEEFFDSQDVDDNKRVLVAEAYSPPMPNNNSKTAPAMAENPMFLMGAGPKVHSGARLDVLAEFLYLRRNDSVQMYFGGVVTAPNTNVPDEPVAIHYLGGDFEPGVRLALGLDFAHDGWDMQFAYTWWRSDYSHTVRPTPAQGFVNFDTFFVDFNAGGNYSVSESNYSERVTLNTWDLNLGRNFYVSRFLTLRPCIGIVSTYIPLSIRSRIEYLQTGNPATPGISNSHVYGNGLGFGGKVGCAANWYFAKQWSVKTDYSVSLLWTRFHSHFKDVISVNTGEFTTADTRAYFSEAVTWHQLFLGLSWDMFLRQQRSQLQFYVGWEFDTGLENRLSWDGQIDFMSIQGLRLGGRFDF